MRDIPQSHVLPMASISIDGVEENPDFVAQFCGSTCAEEPFACTYQMRIDEKILAFELEQCGVTFPKEGILFFIQRDISETPSSFTAYLDIAKGIYQSARFPPKNTWGLLRSLTGLQKKKTYPKWLLMKSESVHHESGTIVFCGKCVPSQNPAVQRPSDPPPSNPSPKTPGSSDQNPE